MTGAAFDWFPLLEPGEQIIWQGRPREGAGWRCLLREAPAEMLVLAGSTAAAVLFIGHQQGGLLLQAASSAAILALLTIAWSVGRQGQRLPRMRYIVTDHRAMSIDCRTLTVLVVDHTHARPLRRETVCGTSITLGAARRFVAVGDPPAWRNATDRKSPPTLRFSALNPSDAPFDHLADLAGAAAPSGRSLIPSILADWLRAGRPETGLPATPTRHVRRAESKAVDPSSSPGMTDYVPPPLREDAR